MNDYYYYLTLLLRKYNFVSDFVPKNATANFIFYRQKDLGKEEEEKRRKEDCPAKILHFTYFPLILLPLLLFILIIILFLLWRTGCCESRYDSFNAPTYQIIIALSFKAIKALLMRYLNSIKFIAYTYSRLWIQWK